ncbi:MAG: tetratricopeptide repeat protein [Candidatus Melainabacteria bacterium]|nr:tetratricopeptide repeat protein [Candidatus Melainabacteria bacterium]
MPRTPLAFCITLAMLAQSFFVWGNEPVSALDLLKRDNKDLAQTLAEARTAYESPDLFALKNGIVRLEKAIDAQPKPGQLAELKYWLGRLYRKDHRDDAAILAFTDALILGQENPAILPLVRKDLADLYFGLHYYDEAGGLYRRIVEAEPSNLVARGNLGICLEQLGFYDLAINELQQVVKLEPGNYFAQYNLGLALVAKQQYLPAKQCFEKAFKASKDDKEKLSMALLGLSRTACGLEQAAEARRLVDRAIAMTPQNHYAYLFSARLYQDQKEPARAYEEVRKAARLAPKDPAVREALSSVLQNAVPNNRSLAQKASPLPI